MDLFNPHTAKAAWEQKRRIFERSDIALLVARLPEDLTSYHHDSEFIALFDNVLSVEYI